MDAQKEVLLGRLAVQRGLISQEQLDGAIRAQAERGGKTPLGGILLERGLISPGQLGQLVDDQKKNLAAPSPYTSDRTVGEDLLGRHALEKGLITAAQLTEALRLHALSASSAHPRRLGEVLVALGSLTFDQVHALLASQGKRLLRCPSCGGQYNVHASVGPDGATCPECETPLVDMAPSPAAEPLKAKGTWYGPAVPPPPPAAVPPPAAPPTKKGTRTTKPRYLDYRRRLHLTPTGARWATVGVLAAVVVACLLGVRAVTTSKSPADAGTSHTVHDSRPFETSATEADFEALKLFLSAHEKDPLACVQRVRVLQERYKGPREQADLTRLASLYEWRVHAMGEPLFRERLAQATKLEAEGRFGEAFDSLTELPDEKDPLFFWNVRISRERLLVVERADQRWREIAAEAEAHASAGRWDEAVTSASRGERLGLDDVAALSKTLQADLRARQERALLAARESAEPAAEQEEEARIALLSAEWQTFVKRFRFEKAAEGYERCLASLRSKKWKREIEARLEEVKGLASLYRRFRDRVNEGKVKDLTFEAGGLKVTITRAVDEETFECKFSGGAAKGIWSTLGTEALIRHLEESSPTPAERLALGALAWDLGFADVAASLLTRAVKADAGLQARVDRMVSAHRGIPAPPGGFLAFRGKFVTAEEKANLEKGLVLFEGQWVTPSDREMLARGMMKVGDKWLPREEAELVKLGYHKYKGKWVSKEEYEEARSKWDAAYEVQTAHYDIRTNKSEEVANELAKVAEADYEECKRFYGGQEPKLPGKEKMTLYAFATYEDYKRHCVETHAEAELQAAGFARSDTNIVVGWDKTGDKQTFLETMAHEAAHLYYFRAVSAGGSASWYMEGMATQFEGFHGQGGEYVFDRKSRSRIWFLKQAASAGRHIPLDQLVAGDALTLINSDPEKALVFYSECWGLVYFLTHTENKAFLAAFQKFRDSSDRGGRAALQEFIDLRSLEPEFLAYVKGL